MEGFSPPIQKVRAACVTIIKNYLPRPYYGPLTYFLAKDEIIHIPLLRTLNDIAKGPLTIIDIGGNHWNAMDPQNIATLGKAMRQILESLSDPVAPG